MKPSHTLFSDWQEREEEKAGRKPLPQAAFRPALKPAPIIILYIRRDVYDFERVRSEFLLLFRSSPCPACQAVGVLRRHASYWKYYYRQPLHILRCICDACGTTHAIIPSFSVPGTSIGTEEAEAYLLLRAQGQSRGRASRVFGGEKAIEAPTTRRGWSGPFRRRWSGPGRSSPERSRSAIRASAGWRRSPAKRVRHCGS